MIGIYLKELNGFLNSLIAYVVMGIFLTSMGLLIWVFPDTSLVNYGYASLDTLFTLGPYVFIFLIPAITMKSFAEEKKMGTLELVLTKPVSDLGVVLGKFMAAHTLVVIALLPSIMYYISVYQLGSPVGNIDTPGVVGSYIGLILLGGVFCSVGIWASSISSNQIVAFILAAFFCYVLYDGVESASLLWSTGSSSLFVKQLGIVNHYDSMSKGLIDSRDLVYFITLAGLMILLTKTTLGSRQW